MKKFTPQGNVCTCFFLCSFVLCQKKMIYIDPIQTYPNRQHIGGMLDFSEVSSYSCGICYLKHSIATISGHWWPGPSKQGKGLRDRCRSRRQQLLQVCAVECNHQTAWETKETCWNMTQSVQIHFHMLPCDAAWFDYVWLGLVNRCK